jgi:hypothetical protein
MVAVRSLFSAPAASALAALSGLSAAGPSVEPAMPVHAGVSDVILVLMVITAVGAAGAVAYRAWTEGTRRDDAGDGDLPPLVFHSSAQNTRRPVQRFNADRRAPEGARRPAPETDGGAGATRLPAATAERPVPLASAARAHRPASTEREPGGVAGVLAPVDLLAADVTLQILPGRLEVLSGDAGMQEIRFVRPPGGEPVVTLGRSSGDPPGHVQLRSPAVSRLHARMRFEDGRWVVSNLSRTNPAVVNGAALATDAEERVLRDGDQLELGDVVLRFRS